MNNLSDTLLSTCMQIAHMRAAHLSSNDDKLYIKRYQNILKQIVGVVSTLSPDTSKEEFVMNPRDAYGNIICLECGDSFQMLRSHLRSTHKLSFDAYKEKHGICFTDKLVSDHHSAHRRKIAKEMGLGKTDKGKANDQ